MNIVYLIGTDGAGKTTIAQRIAESRIANREWSYLYCQVVPRLILPLKAAAKILFMKDTNQFKDYGQYSERKHKASGKLPSLARLYSWIWYIDFLSQTIPKIVKAKLSSKNIIIDRYYLDAVVNQGVLKRSTLREMLAEARTMERLLPRAALHVFLTISEEVAFARKNDIQSPAYLTERKTRYLELAPYFGFHCVDAEAPIDQVFKKVTQLIEERFPSIK